MKRYKGYTTPSMKVLNLVVEAEVFAGSLDTDPFSVGGMSDGSTNAWGQSSTASSEQSERTFNLVDDNANDQSIFN